jgi:hypothetical protein
VTVYRWVPQFTPPFTDASRPLRHACDDRWFVDETYVEVAGRRRGSAAGTERVVRRVSAAAAVGKDA